MPKILQIKDLEKIKAEIQNYFAVNEDARFVRRIDVIALICNGHAVNYVAGLFGINSTAVQRWIHRLNESGLQGLKDKPGRGRRSKFNDNDRLRLKSQLEKSPKDLGYDQARWDGKLLSPHLKVKYGVELKVRQCQNLFKQLDFSPRGK
jgi:transposase